MRLTESQRIFDENSHNYDYRIADKSLFEVSFPCRNKFDGRLLSESVMCVDLVCFDDFAEMRVQLSEIYNYNEFVFFNDYPYKGIPKVLIDAAIEKMMKDCGKSCTLCTYNRHGDVVGSMTIEYPSIKIEKTNRTPTIIMSGFFKTALAE